MKILTAGVIVAAAVVGLVGAVDVTAGIDLVPWRPVSLLTNNLVMHGGRPFIALSELARALGGHGTWDAAKLRYEIQPGPNGALKLNAGPLAALGPGGDPERRLKRQVARRNAFTLGFGGHDVTIDEEEHEMLRPGDPAISLDALARLLGGRARLDTTKGTWVLPLGGPGTPLQFR